jgi:hypothetical protein
VSVERDGDGCYFWDVDCFSGGGALRYAVYKLGQLGELVGLRIIQLFF